MNNNKDIEQKVLDEVIQIKELYYGDPNMDSVMTDLDKGKLEAYRKVLDFFKEERDEAVNNAFREKAQKDSREPTEEDWRVLNQDDDHLEHLEDTEGELRNE